MPYCSYRSQLDCVFFCGGPESQDCMWASFDGASKICSTGTATHILELGEGPQSRNVLINLKKAEGLKGNFCPKNTTFTCNADSSFFN